MTKIYVVKYHTEYEGFGILGIYYFKTEAENCVRHNLRDRGRDVPEELELVGRWNRDGYSIDEYEVK